ncbi:MAG TPA: hypothetical protein VFY18_08880 [Candidatus Limnocylindrales bacterium]|nr:hypothetical protein [Candidatus Limnocylindrales bacterium]
MTIVVPYEPAHEPAVKAFNARLAAGGISYAFPASSVPTWLPPAPEERLFQEFFLAVEDGVVRGGYILKHQDFVLDGEVMSIGAFQLPLSEGVLDRAYAPIGVQLLRDALRRQPLLYTLGIGGRLESAARLLIAARFAVETVPFFFRVEHARPFLRNIQPLRGSKVVRLGFDVAAATGAGSVAVKVVHRVRTSRKGIRPVVVASPDAFDGDVDDVWAGASDTFRFGAVRDRPVLSRLYDAPRNRFIRVTIDDGGRACAWAVLLATEGRNHKYFGDMKVGSIVDLLAIPGYERTLVDACVARLAREGVDIIVTNQSLGLICDAIRGAGFLDGPSNFLFAASPRLSKLIGPLGPGLRTLHFDRGDGDGPINL